MEYKQAMEYIHDVNKFGSKLGLDRIRDLLEQMENPQNKLKFIHVGGTNGKGSTVSFISSILKEAGYKVGIYTSPCIHRFSERIKINNTEISEKDIARIISSIKPKIDFLINNGTEALTEFEIVTAMAFQYFYEQNCDFVVLEVGLGGRLDSTNIIDSSEVSVITTINYDHMDVLGDTLPKIANEKAGIIKDNGSVVLYPQEKAVEEVFDKICRKHNAKLHKVDFSTLKILNSDISVQKFNFENYESLKISLLGIHQVQNAIVAIKTIEILNSKGYDVSEQALRDGLEKAKWPGRLEIVNKKPLFLIDGAHNIEGVKTLANNLKNLFPNKKITFIAGVLKDKDYKSMMEVIIPVAERFITVEPNNSRALSSKELEKYLKEQGIKAIDGGKVKEAVELALKSISDEEVICAFGSLYYIGEVREYFGLN